MRKTILGFRFAFVLNLLNVVLMSYFFECMRKTFLLKQVVTHLGDHLVGSAL